MTAQSAALDFAAWATREGLMNQQPNLDVDVAAIAATITPLTQRGITILRAKQIQHVGFNEITQSISVFFKRAAPTSKKMLEALPDEIQGMTIEYRQSAQVAVDVNNTTAQAGPTFTIRQLANGSNVYACGGSVSVGNCADAGTLGCLVRDANGVLFGLSNNHVTGACSNAAVGMPIIMPGIADVSAGGLDPFTVGHHFSAMTMIPGDPSVVNPQQNHDVAIFRISPNSLNSVSSHQGNAYDTPTVSGPLVPNLDVEKVGRTTGHTHGRVVAQWVNANPVFYQAPIYGFQGLVFYEPTFVIEGTAGDAFSESVDSGALITTVDAAGNRTAVGIVIGGCPDNKAPGGKLTIALPIDVALAHLDLTLVGNYNV